MVVDETYLKIGRLVNAIKRGWLKIEKPKKEEEHERTFYDLWADNEDKHLVFSY